MAIKAIATNMFLSLTLLTLLCIHTSMAASDSDSHLTDELIKLQSVSPSGVIHLTDQLVSKFVTSVKPPRPYSLLIFFDATHLHNKPDLKLVDLGHEVGVLAASFIANNEESPSSSSKQKLFFCEIEYKESPSSFSIFGVNSLPHIRLVTPDVKNVKQDSIKMFEREFYRLAETMADFIESETKLTVGPIRRPPMFSMTQKVIFLAAMLIWARFLIKKFIAGDSLLHDPRVWLAGSVFVYFFSVSGAMYMIIRKMPMFMEDRTDPTKVSFFYQGSGIQLGGEGFIVGFLYTVVGLLLAFVTNVLINVRNLNTQRLVMVLVLLISFWAVKKVVFLNNWKTGYAIHGYLPSSWH